MNRPIETAWIEFERETVPPQAGGQQRRELRNAFFGGAMVMLLALNDAADLADDKQAERLSEINREIEEFGEALRS